MVKKQSHRLKDIQCIKKLEDKGILVFGLDYMQNAQLWVIRFTDLEITITKHWRFTFKYNYARGHIILTYTVSFVIWNHWKLKGKA